MDHEQFDVTKIQATPFDTMRTLLSFLRINEDLNDYATRKFHLLLKCTTTNESTAVNITGAFTEPIMIESFKDQKNLAIVKIHAFDTDDNLVDDDYELSDILKYINRGAQ